MGYKFEYKNLKTYKTNSNPEKGVNNIRIANQIIILFKCKSKKRYNISDVINKTFLIHQRYIYENKLIF